MHAPLDPALAEVLRVLPVLDVASATPASVRDELRALAASRADIPLPEVSSISNKIIRGAAGNLSARVYRTTTAIAPTVIFFHGGGWVAGDLETHDRQARTLAIETGAVIVSVDYRRPPETRFPGAFEDAFAAVRHVVAQIGDYGGDLRRVGVAGDSAGGNLAAATAIACRDSGIALAGQLLVYPATDLAGLYSDDNENGRYPSRTENAEGYFLSLDIMQWFARNYLAGVTSARDWRASPVRATSLAGVASAVVCTAFFDPLRDEGEAYADALAAAGVETQRHSGPGLIHGYFGIGTASAAAKAEAERVRADFQMLLQRGV
jgi:acetyl esterase